MEKRKLSGWLVALLATLFLLPLTTACSSDDNDGESTSAVQNLIGSWEMEVDTGETYHYCTYVFKADGTYTYKHRAMYYDDDDENYTEVRRGKYRVVDNLLYLTVTEALDDGEKVDWFEDDEEWYYEFFCDGRSLALYDDGYLEELYTKM